MDATTQTLLTTGGAASAVALLTATVVWLFMKSTTAKLAPVGLLLVGFCLEIYFFKQPFLPVGLQIYPNDVISLFVLLTAIVGFALRPIPINDSPFLLWLAFGVTIITSFVLGLNEFGRYAGTEVRPFFYMWVAGLYCCAADFSEAELKRVARWCVWTAYAFVGIAIYYWLAVEIGFVDRKSLFGDEDGAVFRPVGSHAVFFVATVALVQTMAWLRGTYARRSGWHAAILLGFVTILQHRSVWIAALAGLLCVLILERRHLPRRFPMLLGFVGLGTLLVAGAASFGYLDDLADRMVKSAVSMTDSQGTFAARVDGWVRLLESWTDASNKVLVFGFPFGRGYTRMYNGQLIEFAPHNFYIDLILRVGIVGAILFLIPTCIAIVQSFRARSTSEFEYLLMRGLAVGLAASLVYYVAYPSYYILGAATGIALAQLIRLRRRRVEERRAEMRAMHSPPHSPARAPLTVRPQTPPGPRWR